ncbi:MAG: CHASE2 domain-containing protein [Thermoleophilaceae bacterium]
MTESPSSKSAVPRRRSLRRLRMALYLITGLAFSGALVAAYAANVFRSAELQTVDIRFSIRGDRPPPSDVILVGVDTKTFGQVRKTWPFPRSLHARVIDQLKAAGAKAIAYDVQFSEPTTASEDNALIESVARAGNVALAATEVTRTGHTNVFGGADLRQFRTRAGNSQLPNDPGAVFRRFPYELKGVKSFAVEAGQLASGRVVSRSSFNDRGTAWIDFPGPPGTVETVSFGDVVNGRVPASRFRGKVVVVGATASSLQDYHPTPYGSERAMSGPEVQADAIHTALEGFPLGPVPKWLDVLLVIVLGLAAPLAAVRYGPARAAVLGVTLGAAFAVATQLAFDHGAIVSFFYAELALACGVVSALGVGLTMNAFERERVRDLFARFVPEQVVDDVLANTDEDLRLGGERRIVTVLFSDIRGFTTFSERTPPDRVIEILNRYLTAMSDVILDHGGTLISYMGDGIMAVFGAPIAQSDHADRALRASRQMAGETLDEFNDWMRKEEGVSAGFRIGIGLNSGPVMAGNVGSERRLEYTAIGDTTNTAARLEGMTKGTPHMIFFADSTRSMLTEPVHDLVHVDDMEVRGKQARVTVWSVEEEAAAEPALEALAAEAASGSA